MDYLKAFLIGGAICVLGQILIDTTKMTPARILVSFVITGVVLGAFGIYKPFAEWAGAGANIPLTGFGNVLAEGTKEAVKERGLIGAVVGPLSSGAAGITVAMICGLIASLVTDPKEK